MLIALATIVGCKPESTDHCKNGLKDEDETGVDCGGSCEDSCYVFTGRRVYVCGYAGGVAKYWIDSTTEVILTDTANGVAEANDIFVYGNDVYVCGKQKEGGKFVAKYWKNGVETKLTNGAVDATATSIVVVNGDVYVAGAERDNQMVAKYWKNGTPTSLTDGTNNAFGNSIWVEGQAVYVSGSETIGAYDVGKYWVNGGVTQVTAGNSQGYVYDIEVHNGKVYGAGPEAIGSTMNSWYWIDGVPYDLGNNVQVFNMDVQGNDVYTCGTTYGGPNNAVYWKNQTKTLLTTGGSHRAWDIDVAGNDVYVCGNTYSAPYVMKYWVNGQEVVLSQESSFGNATGIFVKEF